MLTPQQFKAVIEAMDQFVSNTEEAIESAEGCGSTSIIDFKAWNETLEAGVQVLDQLNTIRAGIL